MKKCKIDKLGLTTLVEKECIYVELTDIVDVLYGFIEERKNGTTSMDLEDYISDCLGNDYLYILEQLFEFIDPSDCSDYESIANEFLNIANQL